MSVHPHPPSDECAPVAAKRYGRTAVKVEIDRGLPMMDHVWLDGMEVYVSRFVIEESVGDLHKVTLEIMTDDLVIWQPDKVTLEIDKVPT